MSQLVDKSPTLPAVATDFPESMLRSTTYWLGRFADDFHGDFPTKIHDGRIAIDGAPQWHPSFIRWISQSENDEESRMGQRYRNPESRLRTTRAMRKLRREAVREFEVLYRVMVLGEPIGETTKWLNDRARRNHIPLPADRKRHYRPKDTLTLVVSAIDKLRYWWQEEDL